MRVTEGHAREQNLPVQGLWNEKTLFCYINLLVTDSAWGQDHVKFSLGGAMPPCGYEPGLIMYCIMSIEKRCCICHICFSSKVYLQLHYIVYACHFSHCSQCIYAIHWELSNLLESHEKAKKASTLGEKALFQHDNVVRYRGLQTMPTCRLGSLSHKCWTDQISNNRVSGVCAVGIVS